METIKEILVIFSERDGNKRITFFKSFIELSIVILYTIHTYQTLFGDFTLIDPTKFTDLYQFFISGNVFVCLMIFIFWFLVVRHIPYYLLYSLDFILVRILIGTTKKFNLKPIELLELFEVLKRKDKNAQHYTIGKRFKLAEYLLKYFYNLSHKELLENLFHNISLIFQFSIILLVFFSLKVQTHQIFSIILWILLVYAFINQLFVFFLLELLQEHGYKVMEKMERFKRFDHNFNTVSSSFNPDKPIFSQSQNLLSKRDYFSSILTSSIINYTDKESLVIGIDGHWGDGKTSFINMSLERFIYNPNDKKFVLFFNPWNFTNPNELTSHFLNELNRNIKKILGNKYSDDLDSKFFLYLNYITNGTFQTPEDLIIEENDTESLKKEIDRNLRSIDFKLIVVIDDLDRLTEVETKQVFRFVKLVGDFPNIIYIIPFDKQKTIQVCNIEENYLMKIIQIEIKLPPVMPTEIYNILNERLKSLFELSGVTSFDFNEWNKILSSSLRSYVRNLRDVNRIINTLKFYLSNNYVKDLNINDFVVLTTIQIFDIGLYNFIGSNRTLFTYSNVRNYNNLFGRNNELKSENLSLLKSAEKSFKVKDDELFSIFHNLFPNLLSITNDIIVPESDFRVFRREHRICSVSYFDKYFLYPIESDKISNEEIKKILCSSENIDLFKQNVLRLINDDNYDFFIDRFPDYKESPDVEINKENVIKGFFYLGKKLPNKLPLNSVLGFTPKENTKYLIAKLILELDMDNRLNLYKHLFKNKKFDIDLLVDVYRMVCLELQQKTRQKVKQRFLNFLNFQIL